MKLEMNEGLRRRAAVHAALGDPGRLAIVDALNSGEARPASWANGWGWARTCSRITCTCSSRPAWSRRHRSEGDRRRSYVTLVRDLSDELHPVAAGLQAGRVVFVCTQNSARSQLAGVAVE